MNERIDHSRLEDELKNLDTHIAIKQERIDKIERKILNEVNKDERKKGLRDIFGYVGSIAAFAVSVLVAFLIFSNTAPTDGVERVNGEGPVTKFISQVDPALIILLGMIGVGWTIYFVIRFIRRKLGLDGPISLKLRILSICIPIFILIMLLISGILGLWIDGIHYLHSKVERYSVEAYPVEGAYSVEIDLSDFESNKGKIIYDDGEHQIYVYDVFVHNETDYQVYFRSRGIYDLQGATLVSGVEHIYDDRAFSTSLHASATASYGGETYEITSSGHSNLMFRDGDTFGFRPFHPDEIDQIEIKNNPIIEITITDLLLNKWKEK